MALIDWPEMVPKRELDEALATIAKLKEGCLLACIDCSGRAHKPKACGKCPALFGGR